MRIDVGGGVRLFVDADGLGLVAEGAATGGATPDRGRTGRSTCGPTMWCGCVERFGGGEAADAARDFWTNGPQAIGGYLQHCMPLYSVEPLETAVMARTVMNFDVLGHFQAGEQLTMDLAPGLGRLRRPGRGIGTSDRRTRRRRRRRSSR